MTIRKATYKIEELRWFEENEAALEESYAGMWIAIEGSRIVGAGASMPEAARVARLAGFTNPLFTAVTNQDYRGKLLIR